MTNYERPDEPVAYDLSLDGKLTRVPYDEQQDALVLGLDAPWGWDGWPDHDRASFTPPDVELEPMPGEVVAVVACLAVGALAAGVVVTAGVVAWSVRQLRCITRP